MILAKYHLVCATEAAVITSPIKLFSFYQYHQHVVQISKVNCVDLLTELFHKDLYSIQINCSCSLKYTLAFYFNGKFQGNIQEKFKWNFDGKSK